MKYPPFLVKTLAISCAKEILSLSVKVWNNPESIALSKRSLWNSSERHSRVENRFLTSSLQLSPSLPQSRELTGRPPRLRIRSVQGRGRSRRFRNRHRAPCSQ